MRDYHTTAFPSTRVLNPSGTHLSGLGKGTLRQYLLQLWGSRVTRLKACDILKVLFLHKLRLRFLFLQLKDKVTIVSSGVTNSVGNALCRQDKRSQKDQLFPFWGAAEL